MKSPPKPRRQTHTELKALQRLTGAAIMRRLNKSSQMQTTWIDGRRTADVVAEFIKPNDRLTSFDRIEIYNRQYWFRLVDCLYDDYRGLQSVLGDKAFNRLVIEYLDRYPSRSYSLRNLGSRLERFMIERPELIASRPEISIEMARFEWAQVVAFDGPAHPAVHIDDLLGAKPEKLRLALQPYVTLLQLQWPLDDWTIALKKSELALRSEASNAVESEHTRKKKREKLPRKTSIHVAVHRYNSMLYYKRLAPQAYHMLSALRDGQTLASAVAAVLEIDSDPAWTADVQNWFTNWTALGWFCKRK